MRVSCRVLVVGLIVAAVCAAQDCDLGRIGNGIMKPLVRVSTRSASGSGVVVYSADREKSGEYQTFVLTNHHVVSDAIHVARKWDSLRQRWIYSEQNDLVTVELFSYLREGRTVIGSPIKATIVAHKDEEDLALLKLDYPLQVPHVAELLPADKPLRLADEVWAVGCSLGVDPLATYGRITDLEEMIDHRPYVMASADIVYGNSGGGVFTEDSVAASGFYFIGVPSRIMVMRNGQALTHMGYFIAITRIRGWLGAQKLTFLLDTSVTPTQSFEERGRLQHVVEVQEDSPHSVE